MLASTAQPAHAFELFGIRLFGSDPAEELDDIIGEPQFHQIEFVVTGDPELEERLRSSSTLWADRERASSGTAGLITKARGDYRRLLAALYAEARYGGTISIRIEGREADDLPPDAVLPATANVLVSVDTGPLFRFSRADIVNEPPPLPADRRDEVDDPRERGFAVGEDARSGAILRAERLSVEAWRHHGHAKAEATERRVEALHDQNTVEAAVTIEPGPLARYGPVGVRGAERLDPEWLAWMTGIEPGRVYDPRDLQRAATRLARLDVFRASRFEEADQIGSDGMLPIDLVVQERLPRRIGVGGTFSTIDGLGAEDPGVVVIDEWIGLWLALFLAPAGWIWMLAGFVLFRIFDILKPWPVSWADRRLKGGFGAMFDDALAGLYALLMLQLAAWWLGDGVWSG